MSSFPPSSNDRDTEDEWLGGVVVCVILAVCFAVGAPGNLLVVWTIVKHVKQRSHTVLLILHLAVADLLVLVTLPLWIYSLARSWVFGQVTCKAMVYIIHVCMYASVFLITVMSVERFLAIRYPLKMLRWKTAKVMTWTIPGIWGLAFLLGILPAVTQQTDYRADGTQHCLISEYDSVSLEVFCKCLETLVGFLIPFFTLVVCYCQIVSQLRQMKRTKPKSLFLITAVVVAFTLCWLPHHLQNIIIVTQLIANVQDELVDLPGIFIFVTGALAFISSSVNPMLYAFAARNFQGGLRKSGMVKLFQEIATQTAQVRGRDTLTPDCSDSGTHKEMASADV
ncbi:leukotriene B4 receptor 1-like [Brachyhypopomus gauderio]|uniref:leukotriene B4 receptor 1-like n=1 Tax=Brachyhypopomus gauderio TaxID=698409 RepID=UPI004041C3B3